MVSRKPYPAELRERAVRMVFEVRAETDNPRGSIARVAERLGINKETLRNWVAQAEVDDGQRPGTTTGDKQRIAELEREVRELRRATTFSGFVYTAFVTDLFSRKIVGWQVSDTLRAELALDALEMAIWSSGDNIKGQLVHHSDRGVQYTSIRYGERLGEIGAVRSVGSKGDSYDNAAAEAVNSLYKRAYRSGR